MLIVFGGPHVPDRAEAFLRDNPFIDLACHGEGERSSSSCSRRSPAATGTASARSATCCADGTFVRNHDRPRSATWRRCRRRTWKGRSSR